MWYGDPNPDNIIWDFKNETLRLIDIDSISISKLIPISYVNITLVQQLEHIYMTNVFEGHTIFPQYLLFWGVAQELKHVLIKGIIEVHKN